MTEPNNIKLLTEADLARYDVPDAFEAELRERGLIAPEPDKRAAAYQAYLNRLEPGCAGVDMRFTFYAGYDAAEFDAERPLTREMVREAYRKAQEAVKRVPYATEAQFVDALHAALTEQVQ
jgi:hypothetical protein